MGSTPWADHLIRRLTEGPVDREEITNEVAALVPPGVAFRKAERKRAVSRRNERRKTDKRVGYYQPKPGDARTVAVGQRAVATQVVVGAIRGNRVVQDGNMLRLGPEVLWGIPLRIAQVRHEQSACYDATDYASLCPMWRVHVGEALEINQAIKPTE